MNILSLTLYHKCLQVIVMLLPVMIWNILLMCEIWLGLPFIIFRILSIIIMILLISFVLLMNSFLIIIFNENSLSDIEIKVYKPTLISLIKSIVIHMPFACILLLFPVWILIGSGIIELLYIILDKNHYSIMERIYSMLMKSYINFKQNHHKQAN